MASPPSPPEEKSSLQVDNDQLSDLLDSAITNTRRMSESLTDLTATPTSSPSRQRTFSNTSSPPDSAPSSSSRPLTSSRQMSESLSDLSTASVSTPVSPIIGSRRRNISTLSLNSETEFPMGGFKSSLSLSRASSTMSLTALPPGMAPMDVLTKRVRDKLIGKLFSGWYTERRYVDAIERYKDVIVVDNVEADVIKQIRYAIRKSKKILAENCFVGFSVGDDECKVYVSLGTGVAQLTHAFGHYWFHVRHLSFFPASGFNLDIVIVRQFADTDRLTCWECRQRSKEATPPVHIDSISSAVMDIRTRLEPLINQFLVNYCNPRTAWTNLKPHLTKGNLVGGFRFIAVLFLTLVAGTLALIRQLGGFSLRVVHELAFLVDRSTPFALGALNFLSKIVGGFYILVAMMWKDFRKPKPPPPQQIGPNRALAGPPKAALPAPVLPNVPRQRPVVTGQHNAMDTMYSSGRKW